MLIALDTSTSWASVALYDGANVLAELTWHSPRRSGDELFPMLERLLTVGETSLAHVDRIAVATGPGSFTGIRVAIAAARGLGRGTNARVAGVSTLDVIAFPHTSATSRVCALLRAGRDDWYAAFYEGSGAPARTSPFLVGTLAAICERVGLLTLFAGELDAESEQALRDLLGPRAAFPPPSLRLRRAGYLAELGWNALESRRSRTRDELEPIYVKPASVTTTVEPLSRDATLRAAGRS